MTPAWSITVESDELERVTSVLGPCAPTETEHDGVWVTHRGGKRVWSCISGAVQWEVTGARTDADLKAQCLPGRLVWHAGEFAHRSASGTVTISLPDSFVAVADSDVGTAVIDLPSEPFEPQLPHFVTEAATATTTVADLYNLLSRTRLAPIGCPDARPPITLAVCDGTLATYVDWSAHDGLRSTYRIPATTTGEARSVIPAEPLMDLLRNLDSDEAVTVRFPDDPSVPLLVSAQDLRATLARDEAGAKRFHDELGQALADASGRACRVLDRGVFSAEFANRTVRVELHDTPYETVRVTTAVCRDLDPTLAVLDQLNDLNATLVGARVWITDETVVAGVDVPCVAIPEIGAVISGLARQLDGLDVFLSALGTAA